MGFLILASFGATYYRYMVKKDYIVQAQTDCDPYSEACFVWNCDPDSTEEGEMCTGNPDEDTWYFKVINKNASQIASCDANDENCDALVCAQNEPDCEFVFCNPENMEENYASSCIDPAKYTLENPIEEDIVCKEGDVECSESEEAEIEGGEEVNNESQEAADIKNIENIESIENVQDDSATVQPVNEPENTEKNESVSEDVSVENTTEEIPAAEKLVQKNEENKGSLPVIE